MRVSDREVMQWVTDALPPGRYAEIELQRSVDSALQLRIDRARAAVDAIPTEVKWVFPTPANDTLGFRVQHSVRAQVMGPRAVDLMLSVDSRSDVGLAVMAPMQGRWRLVWPLGDLMATADLPRQDGVVRLRLPIGEAQQVVVLQVPRVLWATPDRLGALRRGLRDGSVASVQVHVD